MFPLCLAFKLATMKATSADVNTSKTVKKKEGVLSRDKDKPGASISTYRFVVKTPGSLKSGDGRKAPHNCFHEGTIFQDDASNLVRVQPQVSNRAGETVIGKSSFEDWLWNLRSDLAKECHSDNGIFISDHLCADCRQKNQTQSFSGVGAKQQNGKAERAIQTISYWAGKTMVHATIHWPYNNADSVRLWDFAVTHAVLDTLGRTQGTI